MKFKENLKVHVYSVNRTYRLYKEVTNVLVNGRKCQRKANKSNNIDV